MRLRRDFSFAFHSLYPSRLPEHRLWQAEIAAGICSRPRLAETAPSLRPLSKQRTAKESSPDRSVC